MKTLAHYTSRLQSLLIRHLMPGVWQEVLELRAAYESVLQDNIKLADERADMTEIALSLVARDAFGDFTTVFDADVRLPAEYNAILDAVVSRA